MERVTGIGGIFFKARDPDTLRAWYRDHLGVPVESWGGVAFQWDDEPDGKQRATVWSPFPHDTKHYEPSTAPFMINYRVGDLDAMVRQLESHGVAVLGREQGDFGRFAWVMDPEGNKVELWEPPVQEEKPIAD